VTLTSHFSDFDAESGDDDLFVDNVGIDANDNEQIVVGELEDETCLDDRDLNWEKKKKESNCDTQV
jgi:hypothetical protein